MQIEGRKDGRGQYELRGFTVYEIENLNSNCRCILESGDSKIFCNVLGPIQCKMGSQNFDTELRVKIQTFQENQDYKNMEFELQDFLNQIIMKNIQNHLLNLSSQFYQIMAHQWPNYLIFSIFLFKFLESKLKKVSQLFKQFLIQFIVDPNEDEYKNSQNDIIIVQGKNSQNVLHLYQKGKLNVDDFNQMIHVSISATQEINKFLSKKVIEAIS